MKCAICKDDFSKQDIKDFRDMHEDFYLSKGTFICPDCMDIFNHDDTEDELENLLEEENLK